MKTVAVAVIKGGTGKTATAAALAQAAARDGKKVLAVDLDPQANLTFTLAADANRAGAYELFEGAAARNLVQHTPQGVDCIAASPNLCAVTTYTGSARRLKNALQALAGDYDVCIADTPPTIGELVYNALQAADGLLIPLEADTYSLQGLYQIADIARRIRESNPSLQILGTVVSRYNGRTNVNRFMRDAIERRGKEIGVPYLTAVRPGVAVQEAAAFQRSLFEYAPQSNPAKDYMELYRMIFGTEI